MGGQLWGWAIEDEVLRSFYGCRDEQRLAELEEQLGDDLARIDRQAASQAGADYPGAVALLRRVVRGEPLDAFGFVYRWMLDDLLPELGGSLLMDNALSPIRVAYVAALDTALQDLGVESLPLFGLGSVPFPIPIPPSEGGVDSGYYPPDNVASICRQLATALDRAPERLADREEYEREDLVAGIRCLRDWFTEADTYGEGLVLLYTI